MTDTEYREEHADRELYKACHAEADELALYLARAKGRLCGMFPAHKTHILEVFYDDFICERLESLDILFCCAEREVTCLTDRAAIASRLMVVVPGPEVPDPPFT